jgi:hypothetical protein
VSCEDSIAKVGRGTLLLALAAAWVAAAWACTDFEASASSSSDAGGDAQADDGPDAADDGYRAVVLADAPIVYWRMNGISASDEVQDEVGTGNTLFLQGGGHSLTDGIAGDRAIHFDGANSFAKAANPTPFDFAEGAPFTLECWARLDDVSDGGQETQLFRHLAGKTDGYVEGASGYLLFVSRTGGTTGGGVYFGDAGTVVEGPRPAFGDWAHYALVYDGESIALYVNAIEQKLAVSSRLRSRPGDFIVGRDPRGPTAGHWPGDIDEVAVYAKALTFQQIARHKNAGKR